MNRKGTLNIERRKFAVDEGCSPTLNACEKEISHPKTEKNKGEIITVPNIPTLKAALQNFCEQASIKDSTSKSGNLKFSVIMEKLCNG